MVALTDRLLYVTNIAVCVETVKLHHFAAFNNDNTDVLVVSFCY